MLKFFCKALQIQYLSWIFSQANSLAVFSSKPATLSSVAALFSVAFLVATLRVVPGDFVVLELGGDHFFVICLFFHWPSSCVVLLVRSRDLLCYLYPCVLNDFSIVLPIVHSIEQIMFLKQYHSLCVLVSGF